MSHGRLFNTYARRVDGDPVGHQRRSNHQCGADGGQHHTPQGAGPCPLERGAVRYRKDRDEASM